MAEACAQAPAVEAGAVVRAEAIATATEAAVLLSEDLEEVHREAHGEQGGGGINELGDGSIAGNNVLRNVQAAVMLTWTLCCIDLMPTQPAPTRMELQLATGVRN
jgi:hypothetical protein